MFVDQWCALDKMLPFSVHATAFLTFCRLLGCAVLWALCNARSSPFVSTKLITTTTLIPKLERPVT
jgi:hypothetical protein